MSAVLMLPYVWAETSQMQVPAQKPAVAINGIPFYRKRTELLLRRYMFVSLQTGRVPSLIGKEVFRGKATHYRIRNFEDAVIFLLDMEKCLKRVDSLGQELIARIALQEYTQEETAEKMGCSLRTVIRKYWNAIDTLSEILLEMDLLHGD